MLMSYVLDAGRGSHDVDDLAQSWLGHQTIRAEQVTGTGKAQVPFDCALIEKAPNTPPRRPTSRCGCGRC